VGFQDLGPPDGAPSPESWAERAARFLKEGDLACIHVESADEASHRGDAKEKIRAIEEFDALVGAVVERLEGMGDFRILALSDLHTTVREGAHTSAPVPIALFGAGVKRDRGRAFDERLLVRGSLQVTDGRRLMELFLKERP
jgi:2,3-bisphosphoglycerate-independent phosphoglycerate mutase